MDRVEVRLFGPLLVRRSDGSVVEPSEWRSSKNLDLLRLLALDAGQPVAIPAILDALWPDVDEERARASLRTAASHLRKVLRQDCVQRRGGHLLLEGAWVDVQRFALLLGEAERARRDTDHARAVAIAQEAEAVYVGDIESADSSGRWLDEAREHWRSRRLDVLIDAAEAAFALHWVRNSLDFARRAFTLDRHSERAARALMRALAGVGELERALSVYEQVRAELAEDFGVDPSPQTRAVHLQLLTGNAAPRAGGALVGQERAVEAMVGAIAGLRRSGRRSGVVWLCGERGSGRDSVVDMACEQLDLSLRNLNADRAWIPEQPAARDRQFSVPFADVVVMPHSEALPRHAVSVLSALVRRQHLVLVVPLPAQLADSGALQALDQDIASELVLVTALPSHELHQVIRSVLQGDPTPELLRAVRVESGSLAGAASAVARRWLAEGRIVWTPEGLALSGRETGAVDPESGWVRRSMRLLSPAAIDVLCVVAVAGRGLAEGEVRAVVDGLHPEQCVCVPDVLDSLIDTGLLQLTPGGYVLADQDSRREVVDWLRPSERRRVHCLLAELVPQEPASDVAHWIEGGMHQQACDLGIEALIEALGAPDLETADRLVDLLHQLPPALPAGSTGLPLGTYLAIVQAKLRAGLEGESALPPPRQRPLQMRLRVQTPAVF